MIGQSTAAGRIAGYRLEFEFLNPGSEDVSANSDDAAASLAALRIRHAYGFLGHETFGHLSGGQLSPATDDITIINLGSRMGDAGLHYNNGFEVRIPNPAVIDVNWGDIAHTVDSFRGNFVRYDSAPFGGFLLSAAWGEDDIADIATRYSGGFGGVRFAVGIGYMNNGEVDFQDARGSASAIHNQTGLFLSVAGGVRDDQGVAFDVDRNGHFYFAQAGISRHVFPVGATTVYADYGRYQDFSVGRVFAANLRGAAFRRWALTDTGVDRWGAGIEQDLASAGLLVYGQFHHYTASFSGARCRELNGTACTPDGVTSEFDGEDWQAAVVGARLLF